MLDRKLSCYISLPLLNWTLQKGDFGTSINTVIDKVSQESRSPTVVNIGNFSFDANVGFVVKILMYLINYSIDVLDKDTYLYLVDNVISSGLPNYRGVRSPVPSTYNI